MKQKQSYDILSKPIILGRNKISVHTKAAVLSLYEDGEFTNLMPGIKNFAGVSRNVCQQKWLILCILEKLYAALCDKYLEWKIGFSEFCSLCPKSPMCLQKAFIHIIFQKRVYSMPKCNPSSRCSKQ